ncbi:hypothetical protein MRX96_013057 [Rhipicephalus microplus]|uniref:Uncharacterized protein n=1 Tax=Rhipicephalus microplus TaxID=6941 RepID=A0A9J6DTD1_RHIMP|nr:hypothetical protein HPB51_009459 [Rhipicephalus microplus]
MEPVASLVSVQAHSRSESRAPRDLYGADDKSRHIPLRHAGVLKVSSRAQRSATLRTNRNKTPVLLTRMHMKRCLAPSHARTCGSPPRMHAYSEHEGLTPHGRSGTVPFRVPALTRRAEEKTARTSRTHAAERATINRGRVTDPPDIKMAETRGPASDQHAGEDRTQASSAGADQRESFRGLVTLKLDNQLFEEKPSVVYKPNGKKPVHEKMRARHSQRTANSSRCREDRAGLREFNFPAVGHRPAVERFLKASPGDPSEKDAHAYERGRGGIGQLPFTEGFLFVLRGSKRRQGSEGASKDRARHGISGNATATRRRRLTSAGGTRAETTKVGEQERNERGFSLRGAPVKSDIADAPPALRCPSLRRANVK